MNRFFIALLALVASSAQADSVNYEVGATLFTGDYFLQVLASFLFVIFVLLAVMALLKRFNTVGASTGGYIQVLASTPLGQRERAILLQVGTDQILVGVAAGSVKKLHQLSDPVVLEANPSSLSFKEVWNFARTKRGQAQ